VLTAALIVEDVAPGVDAIHHQRRRVDRHLATQTNNTKNATAATSSKSD
jgi:hypothetical protein